MTVNGGDNSNGEQLSESSNHQDGVSSPIVLSSNNMTVEVIIRHPYEHKEKDSLDCSGIQYCVNFRCNGIPILNDKIWSAYHMDSQYDFTSTEYFDFTMADFFRKALKAPGPQWLSPIEPDMVISIYPTHLLPEDNSDLLWESEASKKSKQDRAAMKQKFGALADDEFIVQFRLDSNNFVESECYFGTGVVFQFDVVREELELFAKSLEQERQFLLDEYILGVNPSSKKMPTVDEIINAAETANIPLLRRYAQQGANFNQLVSNGEASVLSNIIDYHCSDNPITCHVLTKALIEFGADPNLLGREEDSSGCILHSPMESPMLNMNTTVLKTLLEAGADPNKPSGFTADETFYDWAESEYRYTVYDCVLPEDPAEKDKANEDLWLEFLCRLSVKYKTRYPHHLVLLREYGAKSKRELQSLGG